MSSSYSGQMQELRTGHAGNANVGGPGETLLVLEHLELRGVGLNGVMLELCLKESQYGAHTYMDRLGTY